MELYIDSEKLKLAIQGLEAIIQESAETSIAKDIAEKTLDEIKNL
tara:strand:+ start:3584 stop:3718 length:135 start_codon:yes stop_codon:yes gene_type:complete